jgi:hypothetical protein
MKRRTLRVQLVETKRTDLVCIGCGQFRTQFAIVVTGESDEHAQAGVHKVCIGSIKVGGKRPDVEPPPPRPTRRAPKRIDRPVDDVVARLAAEEDALIKELQG